MQGVLLDSIVTLTQPSMSWEEDIPTEKMCRLQWPMAVPVAGYLMFDMGGRTQRTELRYP